MSHEEFSPHGQESVDAEKVLLQTIQNSHAEQLKRTGALYKAQEVILEDRRRITGKQVTTEDLGFNNLTHASVAWHSNSFTNHYRIPSIRFSTPQVADGGFQFVKHEYASLEQKVDGERSIRWPFDQDDYDEVVKMLDGLNESRELGILPHLSSDMASIADPNQAMMKID